MLLICGDYFVTRVEIHAVGDATHAHRGILHQCDIATCSASFVCTGGSRTGLGCFVDAQCGASLCTVGDVGAACTSHNECSQSISLDSTETVTQYAIGFETGFANIVFDIAGLFGEDVGFLPGSSRGTRQIVEFDRLVVSAVIAW